MEPQAEGPAPQSGFGEALPPAGSTIAAIATAVAAGEGSVAIVRLSGPEAEAIGRQVFVAAGRATGNVDGQVMVLFVITVAACEAAVGLAMVIALFRKYGTINTDILRLLRG